jgi:hypothetical protein
VIKEINKYRHQIRFWLPWIMANAIGFAAGVVLGEVIGNQVAQMAGWRSG